MAPADLISTALATASDRQLTYALGVFSRVCADLQSPPPSDSKHMFAHAAREALDRCLPDLVQRAACWTGPADDLPEALGAVVALLQPRTGAVTAMAELPPASGPMASLVIQVLLVAALELETAAASGDGELLSALAQAHDSLSTAFSAQGQRDWAVTAARRAVQVYRLLVERHGDDHVEDLAIALNHLSVRLDAAGQVGKSLQASEEAAGLFRRLAETEGEEYLPGLANALANLSVSLTADGRRDEALAAIEEATRMQRSLADQGAGEHRAGLAWMLHNLSIDLAARGRHGEAIDASEEAVRIRRQLAEADPDRFRADLASSLNNQSVRLSDAGRHGGALAATEEAVRIRRQLAQADPGRYLPELAASLNNLSVDLAEMGRPAADALAAAAEAVQIRRRLARAQPEKFQPALAATLHNLSVDLAAAGRGAPALETIQEAVTIRRSLAAARPDLYTAALAGSLRNLSVRLAAAGRPAEAVDAVEESAGIFRTLADRQPGVFRPELATSLNGLSVRLGAVDRYQEALAAIEEAVQLRRLLAASVPKAYLPGLAISLNNMSVRLSKAGRAQEALSVGEEAVRIRRGLVQISPNRHIADLAISLNNLAVDLGDAGRHAEALPVLQEAVQIRQQLAASDVQAALPDLVTSLNSLAEQLNALGRHTEAGQLFAQILAEHQHDAWATGVILLGRGWWHEDGGDVAAAITDARDAIDLLHADLLTQARARRFLRHLRQAGPARFDLAWDNQRGTQPPWLRHLEPGRLIAEQIDRWIASPTLEQEEKFLAANPQLVGEEAEAVLDHLIDDNPGHRGLQASRDIIRAAKAADIKEAYARHRKLLWHEAAKKALASWADAADEELPRVLEEERVVLLSEEAADQAENLLITARRTPSLLWRTGLLALCRYDGTEAAFQIFWDPDTLRQPPGTRALTAFQPRYLALARLRAGRNPDDPDATFIHAVLALATGHTSEADEAISRCTETSTSWDRRARAAHLTELTAIRPDLADGLTRLRSIMATARKRSTAP